MRSFRSLIRDSTLALIVVLLATFSLLLYWSLGALLQEYVDGRLLGLAETLAKLIEERPALLASEQEIVPAGELQGGEEHRHELREAAHSILVLSPDGKIVWKGSNVVPRPPIAAGLLARVRRGQTVYDTVPLAGDPPLRRVSVPIPRHGEVRYILQAETSLGFSQKALRGLLALLALVSAAMAAIAWLGSAWLARNVLTPVERLSATAETVSASALRTRLSLDAPYAEFHRLTQAFNAMMDRLQAVFEAQRRFVDHAAHDMQTPLTVLQGNLELALQKARTAEEYRDALLSNLKQVERLITLTRSLLTLARFAGDRPPVQLGPLALEPLVRELVNDLTVVAEDHRIHLALRTEPTPPVLGDAERLKQLLINLLDNALRYTEPGGRVTVRLQAGSDRVSIAVEDTGQGIEPEHLPHLFERFYRTDRARARDSGGTGLGLPIVKEIAEAHGGTVQVESRIGKGSVFTVLLPIPATSPPSAA